MEDNSAILVYNKGKKECVAFLTDMQMYTITMKKIGYCIMLLLLCCACSAQPDRDEEEFQKDKDTVAQLDTALKKLEDAESFHLKQENDKGQLVDMSIRKSGSRQDTTAKPNDVYAPYEFSGTYTDEKGTAFHIEQTKQSGLMAEVNIADTRLLSLGLNTIRWDKQALEQALEDSALEDYVRICETDDDHIHTCKVKELTVTFKTDTAGYLIYHKSSRDQITRSYTNVNKEQVLFMNKT